MRFISIILAAILFVLVNLMASHWLGNYRLDLTQNKIYTLSSGSKNILRELQEPISLKIFYSERLANGFPEIQAYAARTKAMLQQYVKLSQGKISLEFINPEPFSEEEDKASSAGIQGLPIDNAGNKFYFGMLASNSTDDTSIISFLDPARAEFLEYDLTRQINIMAHPQKPKIALLTSLPMMGDANNNIAPWAIYLQMKEIFDVQILSYDVKEIPQDTKLLMVVHPNNISEDTQYAIDQFILKGGKALLAVDAYTNQENWAETRKRSELNKIFHNWGMEMNPAIVIADRFAAMRVQNIDKDSRLVSIPNVTWMALDKRYINNKAIPTANLSNIRMITSGYFKEISKNSALEVTPLITTSEDSQEISNFDADLAEILRKFSPSGTKHLLAAQLRGQGVTAFPKRNSPTHITKSIQPINVIIMADIDMLRDGFWVNAQDVNGKTQLTPSADNGAFIINSLDYLLGSEDLISLRSRTEVKRPFVLIDKLKSQAEANFREQENSLKKRLLELEQEIVQTKLDVGDSSSNAPLLDANKQINLAKFKQEILKTRGELRAVQRNLQVDIDNLQKKIRLLNIGLIPIIILLLAFFIPQRLGMRRS